MWQSYGFGLGFATARERSWYGVGRSLMFVNDVEWWIFNETLTLRRRVFRRIVMSAWQFARSERRARAQGLGF